MDRFDNIDVSNSKVADEGLRDIAMLASRSSSSLVSDATSAGTALALWSPYDEASELLSTSCIHIARRFDFFDVSSASIFSCVGFFAAGKVSSSCEVSATVGN